MSLTRTGRPRTRRLHRGWVTAGGPSWSPMRGPARHLRVRARSPAMGAARPGLTARIREAAMGVAGTTTGRAAGTRGVGRRVARRVRDGYGPGCGLAPCPGAPGARPTPTEAQPTATVLSIARRRATITLQARLPTTGVSAFWALERTQLGDPPTVTARLPGYGRPRA